MSPREINLGEKAARIQAGGFPQNLATPNPRPGNGPGLILLVGEVVPRLRDRAHRRVRPQSVRRAFFLGTPAPAVVLPIVIPAGDNVTPRRAVWCIKCFHGTTLFPPAVARPERQVALACTADRELNLNLSTECRIMPQDSPLAQSRLRQPGLGGFGQTLLAGGHTRRRPTA